MTAAMTTLCIRYITETDPVSLAIRYQTDSPVSHVEFGLDDGTWLGAHHAGGVQIRPADYCTPSLDDRYAIPVTVEQKAEILAFAHLQVGKPYDDLAIVGLLAHRDWRCADKWFCSELVAAACEAGGLYLLRIGHLFQRVTPRDLYITPAIYGYRYWSMGVAA